MSTTKLMRLDGEHIFNTHYRKEAKCVWRNDRKRQAAVLPVRGWPGKELGPQRMGLSETQPQQLT